MVSPKKSNNRTQCACGAKAKVTAAAIIISIAWLLLVIKIFQSDIKVELEANHVKDRQSNLQLVDGSNSSKIPRLRYESNSTQSNELTIEDGNKSLVNNSATMGYYNLSCPFEWYKFSCASLQENEYDEQVAAASRQYYRQHLSEIWRAFDSVFNVEMNPPKPTRIFMTGDSLLRQVFVSVACNAFSLNAVEHSEVQWRDFWPCPAALTKCAISGGQHSGFDAASVRFTNGMEIHYVPHEGISNGDWSKAEPDVLQRMKRQVATSGNIDFGTKTAFPPSGKMDILVYNLGAHASPKDSKVMLNSFASEISMPLMKNDSGPKVVYVTTPTAHFNTTDGQYVTGGMDDEKSQCVERLARNPRADLEKEILEAGVNVDVLLDYDDLELGALHVHKGDCLHYCMPGAVDLVAARLLESF